MIVAIGFMLWLVGNPGLSGAEVADKLATCNVKGRRCIVLGMNGKGQVIKTWCKGDEPEYMKGLSDYDGI